MFRLITIFLIVALSGVGVGCYSSSHVEGEGYRYSGRMFESPVQTARAHSIARDANTRHEVATRHLDIYQMRSMSQLELQKQLIICIRQRDYDCVNAIQAMGVGLGGYVGTGGWGSGGMLPHNLDDGSFYNE